MGLHFLAETTANFLTPVAYACNDIVNSFNTTSSRKLQKNLENKRHETQLQIAYAQMASQWKLKKYRQDFKTKIEADRQNFQAKIVEYQCQENRKLQEFIKAVDLAITKSDLEFQTWLFCQQKDLQKKLVEYNRQMQLEMATYQRETVRQTEEYRKILENWPLKLVCAQIIGSHEGENKVPLRVILAPPEIENDKSGTLTKGFPQIEKRLSQGLRTFLEKHYPTYSKQRGTELLDRAWNSDRFGGGASIKALFDMLKSEPTLVLESEVDGDVINLRLAYWSGGQDTYLYKTVISNLPYREFLDLSAKTRALEWETSVKQKLLALGKNESEINEKYGKDNAINLEILKEREIFREAGIPVDQHLKTNHEDMDKLCQFLTVYHNLLTAFFADVHYLIHDNLEPQLPQLLVEIIGELSEYDVGASILQWTVDGFLDIFKALQTDRAALVPDLSIDLAVDMLVLPEKSLVQKMLKYSVSSWLNVCSLSEGNFKDNLAALESVLESEEVTYADKFNHCLASLSGKSQLEESNNQQEEIERQRREEQEKRRLKEEEAERKPREEEEKVARQRQEEAKRQRKEGEEKLARQQQKEAKRQLRKEEKRGQEFHFEIITVNSAGEEINRRRGSARQEVENLPQGATLEMVYIPGGTFTMGSPESEESRYGNEGPQHEVQVPSFYFGKYPVTQAQYEAIMGNNPSHFKGEKRPVECITWQNAVEFCQKLSEKTGKTYRLPSEAEWEYACRAGTTTPFYFGETITPELANYEGKYTYASGPQGADREQTTDVGSFPPNAFGLYDMHGLVWEWCQDVWHEFYNGAPTDGSAWESDGDPSYRVQRGGSWLNYPRLCRCANRYWVIASYWGSFRGFRVVLVPEV